MANNMNEKTNMSNQEITRFCIDMVNNIIDKNKSQLKTLFRKGHYENKNEVGFLHAYVTEDHYNELMKGNVRFTYRYVTAKTAKECKNENVSVLLEIAKSDPNVLWILFEFGYQTIIIDSGIKKRGLLY